MLHLSIIEKKPAEMTSTTSEPNKKLWRIITRSFFLPPLYKKILKNVAQLEK
jgi:hypothetical protein